MNNCRLRLAWGARKLLRQRQPQPWQQATSWQSTSTTARAGAGAQPGVAAACQSLSRLSDEERMLRDSVRRLAREELAPRVRRMEAAKRVDGALLRVLFEAGLMGLELEAELGGAGASFFASMLAVEELARVDASVAVLVDIQNTLVVAMLRRFGSAEQRARHLPRLARRQVGSFCLSEPEAGTDAFALRTRASRDPADPDCYLLRGSKLWISNADIADLFIVFANAEPEAKHRGITAFLVERETPGLTVGPAERKLGLEASGTCALQLEDVRVRASDSVIGEVGKGYRYAAALLNESRVGIGAQMLGIAQGCLDATVPYTLQRKQFNQTIFSFQSVQHQIAQMSMELECARLLVYNAARLVDSGAEVMREAAMAKLYASEMAQRLTSKCIDLMGGIGFTKDYPQEKFYRDCKAGTIYEGTSNMQLTTIAKCIRDMYS